MQVQGRAMGASIAALGLSNKAVFAGDEPAGAEAAGGSYTEGPDLAPNPTPSAVAGPPLEEHLAQNTLWPEIVKLYGHANHVFCMAADPRGRYLASACKVLRAPWDALIRPYVCPALRTPQKHSLGIPSGLTH